MTHFKDHELACPCCGLLNFHPETLARLNDAREIADIPFVLSSACRCPTHNAEVGGKTSSAHLTTKSKRCRAVDVSATESRQRSLILTALIAAGFSRIGIAKDFIHADDDPNKAPRVCWLY
ncbi:D-Ala-D-Ala carboxypeptidase family metallohydrolase [Desulfobaculum bizertense]|uniref:D-Ala-D-Ala carboxypeptidase family metallohydrolase n=1 Tax=Desulfobaculum bizertense TaxID=376490 RepID=UPI001F2689BF|nr:D-Ala-D-Ala carboxypeptidase family metallohydrolase [Desulfobaculum bizertense]UIJ36887.1 D-Ala-D-Ala carboxypeptidase family metallohydrolase [Desulfobaculum bizertense]